MFAPALRIAFLCGIAIDAGVGLLALFAQPLMPTVLDIPIKDAATPFQVLLIALYVAGAVRPGTNRNASPFMQ